MDERQESGRIRQQRSYAAAANLLKALADERRLRILALLIGRELCVCELVDALRLAQYDVSRHLTRLKRMGLVTNRREGLWAYYSIAETAREDPLRAALLKLVEVVATANRRSSGDFARLEKRLALRQGTRCVVGGRAQ